TGGQTGGDGIGRLIQLGIGVFLALEDESDVVGHAAGALFQEVLYRVGGYLDRLRYALGMAFCPGLVSVVQAHGSLLYLSFLITNAAVSSSGDRQNDCLIIDWDATGGLCSPVPPGRGKDDRIR